MRTTSKLINTPITSHNYLLCVCVVRIILIYSFKKPQVYSVINHTYGAVHYISRTYLLILALVLLKIV